MTSNAHSEWHADGTRAPSPRKRGSEGAYPPKFGLGKAPRWMVIVSSSSSTELGTPKLPESITSGLSGVVGLSPPKRFCNEGPVRLIALSPARRQVLGCERVTEFREAASTTPLPTMPESTLTTLSSVRLPDRHRHGESMVIYRPGRFTSMDWGVRGRPRSAAYKLPRN